VSFESQLLKTEILENDAGKEFGREMLFDFVYRLASAFEQFRMDTFRRLARLSDRVCSEISRRR
jgi:hypothetical protein